MPTYNKDAYDISRAFGRIENELLGSMMRNMERHRAEERDYGFDWPQWQALQLQELRRYREENKEKFREDFDNINSQVESALRVAYESGQSDQEAVILDQIRRGKLEANRSFDADFFRLNNRRIDSLVEATTNDIKTTEQAILRMANDKYRQIVFDAQVYFASGAGTYEKAVDMAAHDMLMAGLNCIEYRNGARHTAADYAEMVIRTSGQRAYLRGEGQKRNEWGVHTVIVNKRGNPCPKCAPWCGKVMIDDVYAGATASEAKESGYPRVSTAMQAGFLHPRCKDTYTTWFPGVSQKPKPWTKEELASLDENARKEAEQKHAEKMAEKCGRVSRFSLDPEKQKIYEKRAEQWGEKAENLKSEGLTQRRRQRLAERRRGKIQSAFDQVSAGQLRDYIDNNLVTEFTGLDGANTDFVREAVKVISTFEEMMGGKTIDGLSVQFGGTPKGVYAKYNDKTKTILLKKTGSIEKLEESLKRENLRYRMRWKTDKDYHATETFSGQVWHELGHAVDVDTGQALSRSLSADSALDELSVKVSSYAGSTQNVRATKRSEAWAENFAAYMDGGRNKERVPKQIEEKIKGYFEQKAAGKAKNVAKAGKRKSKKTDVPDVKEKEPFIPAKTIEEAEEAARAMGVKYAEYGKLPLETANILNDAIETLPPEARPLFVGDHVTLEKFRDAKIGRNSSQFYGVTVDSTGTISPGRDPVTGRRVVDFDAQGSMVGISSRYKTPAKIEAAKKKTQDAYMAKHNGRKWFFNESGEATIYHEMGHVYQDRYGLPAGFKADAERWAKESGCDMLKNPSEAFSEAWAAYHTGNPDLPDYIAKYIVKGTNASINKTVDSVAKYDEDGIVKYIREVLIPAQKTDTIVSRQAIHRQGTKSYIARQNRLEADGRYGPSYITITDEEILELVNRFKGTGIIKYNKKGEWDNQETIVDNDKVVGIVVNDRNDVSVKTTVFKIHYGKKGIHIVPDHPSKLKQK